MINIEHKKQLLVWGLGSGHGKNAILAFDDHECTCVRYFQPTTLAIKILNHIKCYGHKYLFRYVQYSVKIFVAV